MPKVQSSSSRGFATTGSGVVVLQTSPTIITPVIASIVNTGTLTLPTVAGTIVQFSEASISSSATPSPTGDARENYLDITALSDATATFAAPSGTPANHNRLHIRIKDNGTSRTLAWNGAYTASSDLPLPGATNISKTMYLLFEYSSASSSWNFLGIQNNFS